MFRQKGQNMVWKIKIIVPSATVGIMLPRLINNAISYYTQGEFKFYTMCQNMETWNVFG
jgi:hypothetical protein